MHFCTLNFLKLYVLLFPGITYLTGENFLDVLDNGVELCQLAAVIHDRAREALDQGLIVGVSAILSTFPTFSFSNQILRISSSCLNHQVSN